MEQYQCHHCGEPAYDVVGGAGEETGKCANNDCWVVRFEASEEWYQTQETDQ